MTIHDITRLIVRLWVFIFIIQKRQNERGRRTNRLPQTVLSVFFVFTFLFVVFLPFPETYCHTDDRCAKEQDIQADPVVVPCLCGTGSPVCANRIFRLVLIAALLSVSLICRTNHPGRTGIGRHRVDDGPASRGAVRIQCHGAFSTHTVGKGIFIHLIAIGIRLVNVIGDRDLS